MRRTLARKPSAGKALSSPAEPGRRVISGECRSTGMMPAKACGMAGQAVVHQSMLTARAATIAKVMSEMAAWVIISTFAHPERTGTSVGENAVLVLKATKR